MSVLLEISRLAVVANLGLLAVLGYVWVSSFRRHGAMYPLALSIFAGFLVVQNVVWLYLYSLQTDYIDWFLAVGVELQAPLMALCVLETVALVVLAWLTLQ